MAMTTTANLRKSWFRAALSVMSLVAVACSSGCGLHLHNDADEARAKKASDSFVAADVSQYITAERAVAQQASERDTAATRQNVLAERDAAILFALSETRKVADLASNLSDQLDALGLKDPSLQRSVHDLPDLLKAAMQARNVYLVSISNTSVKAPAFPPTVADEAAAKKVGGASESLFNAYKQNADAYFAAITAVSTGKIGVLNDKLKAAADVNNVLSTELKKANDDLKQATAAYKDAAAAGAQRWDNLKAQRDTVNAALKQFDELSSKLDVQASKAGLEDLLAQIRLDKLRLISAQLSEFMGAFADDPSAPAASDGGATATPSKAQVAGRTAAVLINGSKELHDADTNAKLVPLVFAQEQLRLESERLQRRADRGQQRVALLEAQRDACIAEGMKLMDAANIFSRLANNNASLDMTSVLRGQAPSSSSENSAAAVYGVFKYAESISVDKLHEEEAEVALIGLDHDEALDASEYALLLWKHTIASPLEQLLAYHASGLKSQDVADLVQAASLIGIAVGVN